ncbi:MAG: hypothetical protein NVS1B13_05000 [Flavisolibacter sp.]
MIGSSELRRGNFILEKINNKIVVTRCSYLHFDILSRGEGNNLYPILLKADILEKCGFKENEKYALFPNAREFSLLLPINGSNKNEIYAYIKTNKECFARATVDQLPASNNIFTLHQLQNLYFFLTGTELPVQI